MTFKTFDFAVDMVVNGQLKLFSDKNRTLTFIVSPEGSLDLHHNGFGNPKLGIRYCRHH